MLNILVSRMFGIALTILTIIKSECLHFHNYYKISGSLLDHNGSFLPKGRSCRTKLSCRSLQAFYPGLVSSFLDLASIFWLLLCFPFTACAAFVPSYYGTLCLLCTVPQQIPFLSLMMISTLLLFQVPPQSLLCPSILFHDHISKPINLFFPPVSYTHLDVYKRQVLLV